MFRWFPDNAHSIERTPLIRSNCVRDGVPATILAKPLALTFTLLNGVFDAQGAER